ncbi:General secretion pathway L protein, partial [Burkholderia cenocepacia PC184]
MPLQEWQWPELPFTLVDKAGQVQRAGRAALALLPRANATVLIVAARDVLLLAATVPPLKGPKLRQALPNIVEDQLIPGPARAATSRSIRPRCPTGVAYWPSSNAAWFPHDLRRRYRGRATGHLN